jgi:hypothetical protein
MQTATRVEALITNKLGSDCFKLDTLKIRNIKVLAPAFLPAGAELILHRNAT